MSYLLTPKDPRPNKSDAFLSEQVKMIEADDIPLADHETEVNTFLVMLRDDINHTAGIRSVNTQTLDLKVNGDIDAVTTIHYLLIGTEDAPYIP